MENDDLECDVRRVQSTVRKRARPLCFIAEFAEAANRRLCSDYALIRNMRGAIGVAL